MSLLNRNEYSTALNIDRFGGETVSKLLMQLSRINKINEIYSENSDKQGIEFIDSVINSLQLKFDFNKDELKRIPKKGAFITVSNHPLGGVDGLILLKIISEIRPDFKLLANYLLHKIDPVNKISLPLNHFENHKLGEPSLAGIKNALKYLREGNPLGVFPAGEVSTYQSDKNTVSDREWQYSILKFIKYSDVPIVPVYFKGNNSFFFHLLGKIHPLLQTARLPSEMFNKKNKTIQIRIGNPIRPKELEKYTDISMLGRYLRAKTYALGTSLEVTKFFRPKLKARIKRVQKIIDPVPKNIIVAEIEKAKSEYLLFKSGSFSVLCPPSIKIPNVLTEIGRLREVTFRKVGEGTNRSLDLDEFDLYFRQLIVWNEDEKEISGAYRVGKGNDILAQYGVKGFYIQTLFKINKEFFPILNESIELGRSFIVEKYQKRPLSLFLLWKGLLYFLLKHQEYRYLIGPASISNEFSKFSKGLIVSFFKSNYFDIELAKYLKPRKKFKIPNTPNVDDKIFLDFSSNDLNKLDRNIKDIENDFGIPILFKKYIKLKAKIIGFNIDPKFNDCLDGLIILDIFDIPLDIIKSLSKEINDVSILDRFNFTDI